KPHLIYAVSRVMGGHRLIVTFSEQRAREIVEAYRFFEPSVRYFPAKDILFYQSDIRGNAITRERMAVYRALAEEKCPVVVTTFDALMDRLIPPSALMGCRMDLAVGESADPEDIRGRLAAMGYAYAGQTEEPGEFSARGGILDIFPLTEEVPYRIEFWGDEIDSIRSFSPESQRSIENAESLVIYPASEMVLSRARMKKGLDAIAADAGRLQKKYRDGMRTEEAARICHLAEGVREELTQFSDLRQAEGFLPYFYEDTVDFVEYFSQSGKAWGTVFIDEAARCLDMGRAVEEEYRSGMEQRLTKGYILPRQADMIIPADEAAAKLGKRRGVIVSSLESKNAGFSPKKSFYFTVRSVNAYNGSFELLVKDLKHYKREKYAVILLSASRTRARRLAGDLFNEGLTAFYSEDTDRVVQSGEVMVLYGALKKGFAYPDLRFVVLTEEDIFGVEKKKRPKKRSRSGLTSFDQLSPGDYVIHESHGLGIFRGIEKVEVNHTLRDFMKIEYGDGGNLYVPATQLDMIQKYSGADDRKPKLNRLGGQEWKKTTGRVKKSVQAVAGDLVDLYAARQSLKGFCYGEDTIWQREFEEMFPYEETDDQLRAIADVKADMESDRIMDRLICGDVGFGKTEVAMRAAFKAVQENRQVAYLVPTTILAQQHYNNFVERLKSFPVNVELLCRFRTSAQIKETLKRMREGLTDIVIGTHRLLSKDVGFKDLGLLIIDEEQRFGVSHKEKIKQMKKNVDVLSLTATPIPRTLHMSLVGIRDMSVLEEPPQDRLPIQTYIMEYNEEMVREAIERELARGGQVYYVYNRVRTIAEMTARVAALVPSATVAFAHGQMSERELENVMYRFINGEIDVLVSTTIIETGMDIPNVNTMVVHDADNMGLAQLYQLRGRIGRSNRTAYAFFMYRRDRMLKEVAEKRLAAIREFTELGSGIRIAMKDLEIRGAGNLLGEEQHGHMEAVGYELYCKMLDAAVKEARGQTDSEAFDTAIDLNIDAWIPPDYIENEFQKLDIYKRIAAIRTIEEKDEMTDELTDRFGEPPRSVVNLLTVSRIREAAHEVYITEIRESSEEIRFFLYERARIDPAGIPELINHVGKGLSFSADLNRPSFIYRKQKGDGAVTETVQRIIAAMKDICL
ncbi:MAG: transcription-repair coupling factor, partial [Clostridiales bacterium]|nr:transcription-repair coupling factor [Clostridiales bacterium]